MRLSRILVGLLLVWAILDVAGRLGPVGWLHLLPEHIATRRPGFWHPFIPNLKLHSDPWIGETATTGNLEPTETRPPIDFSTDEAGFRSTPGVTPQSDIDLVLYGGASFGYGGGLSDTETLPSVLTREAGLRTYNGGHFWWDPQWLASLDWLRDRLGHGRRAVLMLYWEENDFAASQLYPPASRTDRIGSALVGHQRYENLHESIQFARRYMTAAWNISPLQVLSIRGYKALSNDWILPNQYKDAVVIRTSPTGQRWLFLLEEVRRVMEPPDSVILRRNADYFEEYARHLAARNTDFHVVLIPNRYTVYGPLIDGARAASADPYLNRLERELTRRNISVLNGLPVLEAPAASDMASGQFSFYREDHHWTPLGVQRIAAATASFLRAKHTLAGPSGNAVQ